MSHVHADDHEVDVGCLNSKVCRTRPKRLNADIAVAAAACKCLFHREGDQADEALAFLMNGVTQLLDLLHLGPHLFLEHVVEGIVAVGVFLSARLRVLHHLLIESHLLLLLPLVLVSSHLNQATLAQIEQKLLQVRLCRLIRMLHRRVQRQVGHGRLRKAKEWRVRLLLHHLHLGKLHSLLLHV